MACFPTVPEEKAEIARMAVDTATEILWAMTGRQFGLCPAVYNVEKGDCVECEPTLWRGDWYNIDPSGRRCQFTALPGPVFEITRVEDRWGRPLEYRAHGDGVLTRMGTPGRIVYVRGVTPPTSAGYMVGRLASERYLQCVDPKACKLPSNTTSVTRQGVTVQMSDPVQVINAGMTGLPDVDSWVKAVNPHGLMEESEVLG